MRTALAGPHWLVTASFRNSRGGCFWDDPERVRRTALHRLNEFLPRSFDTACPSDRWHDTSDFERAKIRDDHPFIACGLLRNGRAAW